MFKLSFALSWSLVVVSGGFGCSSRSLAPTNPRQPIDASMRPFDAATKPIDASSHPVDASMRRLDASSRPFDASLDASLGCGCQVGADGVMHMSWTCLQTYFGGATNVLRWCGAPGSLTSACGLVVYTYRDGAGLQEYVYDESTGIQVGGHYETNVPGYAWACPDQGISALKVEGGTLPASSCTTGTPCGCNAEGRAFACPPPADAGTSSWDAGACGCRIDANGALRMNIDCWCGQEGCGTGSPWHSWCGAPAGQWTSGCGLYAFTYEDEGLSQTYVYDATGTEVGLQLQHGGTSFFQCPTDPSLQSPKLVTGAFPAATCATAICACDQNPGGGYTGTFTCPTPDGGPPLDAAQDH